MKTIDYINTLNKENESLKALCKSHVATIRSIKKELSKLNNIIAKKDKKILKLESESPNVKTQKEFDTIKIELDNLKSEYDILLCKYNDAMRENEEIKCILDYADSKCDSD